MTLRKMVLIASMALAVLAFAVPASASAYTWTYNGVELAEGETASGVFEGPVEFRSFPGNFTCEATLEIEAEGLEVSSSAKIVRFERDPSSCVGTFVYSKCSLEAEVTNVGYWDVNVASSPPKVTDSGPTGLLEIQDIYKKGCWAPWRYHRFQTLPLNLTLDEEGGITKFSSESTDWSGTIIGIFGPFTPTGAPELGLK